MNFVIQASKPRISGEYNLGDRDISEAIETIFPMNTESAILQWNCISIPLSYKYDISYMIWDILNLLEQLQTEPQGMMMIQWLPDTFRVDWKIVWKDNQMTIKSYWESVVGGLEELLNQKPVISLKIDNFLYEWKEVLYTLICALKDSGYKKNLCGMEKLEYQFAEISKNGVLYS
ncbi:hypothetical protein [Methanobrevibacter sp.]|uniref:hypothetical protein n=1 Tax=Methanobrevibacter sp. TaxID=66852 RepID=UPI00386598E3